MKDIACARTLNTVSVKYGLFDKEVKGVRCVILYEAPDGNLYCGAGSNHKDCLQAKRKFRKINKLEKRV